MHPGFNHNIQYRGRIYHIQTEDSGEQNPHVITHLFCGGNIIDSVKSDYRNFLSDRSNLASNVVELMKRQHKEMMRFLINGRMDERLGLPKETPQVLDEERPEERAQLLDKEDEGELFLGVISEKSLDEVILSFLSDEEAKSQKPK